MNFNGFFYSQYEIGIGIGIGLLMVAALIPFCFMIKYNFQLMKVGIFEMKDVHRRICEGFDAECEKRNDIKKLDAEVGALKYKAFMVLCVQLGIAILITAVVGFKWGV